MRALAHQCFGPTGGSIPPATREVTATHTTPRFPERKAPVKTRRRKRQPQCRNTISQHSSHSQITRDRRPTVTSTQWLVLWPANDHIYGNTITQPSGTNPSEQNAIASSHTDRISPWDSFGSGRLGLGELGAGAGRHPQPA